MRSPRVRPVQSRTDLRTFTRFPYEKYRAHPLWVPPPLFDRKAILNRRRHPFYREAEAEFFLAEQDGAVVGTVAAIRNRAYESFHGEKTGHFGFFETDERPETARALLEAASDWCAGRGLTRLEGPFSPSTNYECGLLVEGFDQPPCFMMPYNPPGYPADIEGAGFAKVKDLLAFYLDSTQAPLDRLERLAERVEAKNLRSRPVRLNRLSEELEKIFAVYNDAWSKNWGFVPLSRKELEALAEDLKWVCDPRLILLLEKDGEPVGFLLAMPDLNRIFKGLGGRLLPFGWLKLLRGRKHVGFLRVLAMGLKKDCQNIGYTALLYRDIIRAGGAAGSPAGEIGWVLEDNALMVRAAAMLGATLSKRYRIYGRDLA